MYFFNWFSRKNACHISKPYKYCSQEKISVMYISSYESLYIVLLSYFNGIQEVQKRMSESLVLNFVRWNIYILRIDYITEFGDIISLIILDILRSKSNILEKIVFYHQQAFQNCVILHFQEKWAFIRHIALNPTLPYCAPNVNQDIIIFSTGRITKVVCSPLH